jgi:serine/threonine protein kinase
LNFSFFFSLNLGGTLKEYIQDKEVEMEEEDRLIIAKDICLGLKHLHENNIIHR